MGPYSELHHRFSRPAAPLHDPLGHEVHRLGEPDCWGRGCECVVYDFSVVLVMIR